MREDHQKQLLFRQIDKKLFKSLYDSALAHGSVVSSRQTAHQRCDPYIRKCFLQYLNGNLIKDDLTTVIGNIYNI